ncbi:UNVERIFIED_ORG: HTH-type transcriptional regulator/antitoxin HipB [Sphingomonas sp. R1F5B]
MPQIVRSPRQLGNIIQRARKQRGLTQTDLAGLSGLRQELISRIETGHEGAKLSSIYALCAALDLELVIDSRSGRPRQEIEDVF